MRDATTRPDSAEAVGRDGTGHVAEARRALTMLDVDRLRHWGHELAWVLGNSGRLLAAGNGGSAAQAQHLTAELVGRYREDRQPLSAIALHADTSGTAIGNDYGYDEVFARQVRGHGRAGDVLILLSASGLRPNLLRAVEAAKQIGMTVWAMTGRGPNPLSDRADDTVAVDAVATATVQECHLVAIHVLCAAVDSALGSIRPETGAARGSAGSVRRLVVVGDVLLDRDLVGTVDRVAPEAPVVAVDGVAVHSRPGGAGLAALLAVRAGYPVTLVTALAADPDGRELGELLHGHGVDVIDLGLTGLTPVKSRVRAQGQPLIMFNQGTTGRRSPLRRSLAGAERALLFGAAAVLVSDYGRGITADPSIRQALAEAAAKVPVIWDPHPRGTAPVPGVRMVTPNVREAGHFAPGFPEGQLSGDIERARVLTQLWSGASVVVTRGAEGAVLLDPGTSSPLVVPGSPVTAPDTCGAGDCFAVALTGLLADGALPSEAVVGAVDMAAAFVASGAAYGLLGMVASEAFAETSQIEEDADTKEIAALLARIRAANGTIIATGGCFDLLHAGHVSFLASARELGDCLVVCLNSDESVTRLKGPDRPVISAPDRARVLAALKCVDGVVVFAEETPAEALRQIRPDVYVKGGDYRLEDVPEAAVVESWGGRTVILPYVEGHSTSRMIEKISQSGFLR